MSVLPSAKRMIVIWTFLSIGSSAIHAQPSEAAAARFGEQVSESGILHSFLITGSRTAIIGEDGRIVWEVPGGSRDGFVLSNGNVLVSHGAYVNEYQRDGKIVFHYDLSAENSELGTAARLENGRTLIVEKGPKPRLLEVDPDGTIAIEVPLQPETDNAHMQTRMARKLQSGNYLVPHLLAFAVKEYTAKGEVVKIWRTDLEALGGRAGENWPFTAIRLEGGRILVDLTHGNKCIELDGEGNVVWKVDNDDIGGRLSDPCGCQRLPNGDTVICCYGQHDPAKPKVFEVTADRRVVWEYVNTQLTGVHEIHVLTTNGKPVPQPPMK